MLVKLVLLLVVLVTVPVPTLGQESVPGEAAGVSVPGEAADVSVPGEALGVANARAEQVQETSGVGVAGALGDLAGVIFDRKHCFQCAVWISSSQQCVGPVAQWLQDNYFQGADGYRIESTASNGGWVRYWRTGDGLCNPKYANNIHGTCGGQQWHTANAQAPNPAHPVYCTHQH